MQLTEHQKEVLRYRPKLAARAGEMWSLRDFATFRPLCEMLPGMGRAQIENYVDAIYCRYMWDKYIAERIEHEAFEIMTKALMVGAGLRCMRYYEDTRERVRSWGDLDALEVRNNKFKLRLFEIEQYRRNAQN